MRFHIHRWKVVETETIRYGLIQTLTGAATGARYVPGPASPERARADWADETMSD